MKETRTAILFSGSAYNVRFSIQSLMDNVVLPNNADVFIVTERRMKRRKTVAGKIPTAEENEKWVEKTNGMIGDEDQPLTDAEIELIKNTFGERLKAFYLIDDHLDYMEYLVQERSKMMHAVNWYREENEHLKLPQAFGSPITSLSDGNLRCVVDQYRHVKKCYDLMEEYESQNNFRYNYVMRARIDFVAPEIINIEHYTLNHDRPYLYVMGSVWRDEFEFSDEFCWFSERKCAEKLYPELTRMGLIVDRKYNTILLSQNNDFRFGAETQFSLFMRELNFEVINVRIYRSAMYTHGNDGYDYMNYRFRRDSPISLEYERKLVYECETDINQLLPILTRYAEQCDSICELGVRFGNSTTNFICCRPKKFVAYDLQYNPKMDYLKNIAAENNVHFDLRIENPLDLENDKSDIEECDLLFIDTNHHATQLREELRLHSPKAKKYIIMHDTTTFYERGAGDDHMNDGMKLAIEPFLKNSKEWVMKEIFFNNNGLMILERRN